MATDISTAAPTAEVRKSGRRRFPPELSILAVMIGMMLLFEVLGWIFVGQSFIANPLRLKIMILQEAEIGIIAVGVTQVIIMGGIDLSSGSVVGMTAMIAASRERFVAAGLPEDHLYFDSFEYAPDVLASILAARAGIHGL